MPRRLLLCLLCLVIVVALILVGRAQRDVGDASPRHTIRSHVTRVASHQARAVAAVAGPTPINAGTAPGTCLAFDPVRGDRHTTVFIDPGHGGVDTGAFGLTSAGAVVYEKDLTLATGLDLLALLRQDGYRVVMSRIDDRLLIHPSSGEISMGALTATSEHDDVEARIECANAAHARALVALHFNAYLDPTVNGAETIYDSARPFSAESFRLATLAQGAVLARLRALGWDVPDRGVIDDSAVGTPAITTEAAAYGHLLQLGPAAHGWLDHPSAMPGIVVEPLFLSHPAEADVAASRDGQQAMAEGLDTALDAFFVSSTHP
jgi:N-acetylmuramoyl-L-alanine amidase